MVRGLIKEIIEYLIGISLAAGLCAFASLAGFDRERVSPIRLLMVVIATSYILFAVMGSSTPVLTMEWRARFSC